MINNPINISIVSVKPRLVLIIIWKLLVACYLLKIRFPKRRILFCTIRVHQGTPSSFGLYATGISVCIYGTKLSNAKLIARIDGNTKVRFSTLLIGIAPSPDPTVILCLYNSLVTPKNNIFFAQSLYSIVLVPTCLYCTLVSYSIESVSLKWEWPFLLPSSL